MKFQLLRLGREGSERSADVINRYCCLQFNPDRRHVTIAYVDAITLRAHCHVWPCNRAVLTMTKQLQSLSFDLLFFAADKWNHVVRGVERSNSRISGAGKRLHRGDDARSNAELRMQRCECHHDHNRRTVWISNDEAAIEAAVLSLKVD